jgi:hypothetical protein
MKFNNYLAVPVVALTILGGTLLATHSAQAEGGTSPLGMNSIVQKLAQRFNLNEAEVKAVFDEQHSEMEKQMQAKMEAELTQAVTDGKLTEDQKQKIIAKRAEMRDSRENKFIEFKAGEEPSADQLATLKAQHQQEMADLKQWAEDNDVPLEYLMPKMFFKHIKHGPAGSFGVAGEAATVELPAN